MASSSQHISTSPLAGPRSSRLSTGHVRNRRSGARSAEAAAPAGSIYHSQQRHPLRSRREQTTSLGGFGTSQPRDTLIHTDDHPHLTRSESPRKVNMRKTLPRTGLAGLVSVAERQGSPTRTTASRRNLCRDEYIVRSPNQRRFVSPECLPGSELPSSDEELRAVSVADDGNRSIPENTRCTCLAVAFLIGFTTAVALIMLLGSKIVGSHSLRRRILLELQTPYPHIQQGEIWEEGSVASVQKLRKRPPLAIIGGSGPEAGIDLASKVVAASQRQMAAVPGYEAISGDLLAPRFSLLSVPELGLSMDMKVHEARVWASLRDAYLELAGAPAPNYAGWVSCQDNSTCASPVAGAGDGERLGVVAIACVTLAYFEPHLEQLRAELLQSPLQILAVPPPKLVSYPAAVGRRLAERFPGMKTVALLGSMLTLDIGPGGRSPFKCPELGHDVGIAAAHCGDWVYEVPDSAAQERLQMLIFSIKRRQGEPVDAIQYKEHLRDELHQLIDSMSSEVVVLACTELPLLLMEEQTSGEVRYGGKILLDATAVLAEELASSVLPVNDLEAV